MKKYTLVVCLIVTFFGYYKSMAQTQFLNQDTKFMIRHTVVFKLKYPRNSPEEQSFLTAAKNLASIPGVQNFECLKQISKKNNFDFGLSMELPIKSFVMHIPIILIILNLFRSIG